MLRILSLEIEKAFTAVGKKNEIGHLLKAWKLDSEEHISSWMWNQNPII